LVRLSIQVTQRIGGKGGGEVNRIIVDRTIQEKRLFIRPRGNRSG